MAITRRRKPCQLCENKVEVVDYKDEQLLTRFVTRTREDRAESHNGHMCATPAPADARDQARSLLGAVALRRRLSAVGRGVASSRGGAWRLAGFVLITLAFAVTQPFVLVGFPLALLLVAQGRPSGKATAVTVVIVILGVLGTRSGIWWFERGWALLIGGSFVWFVALRPTWSFLAQALGALALGTAVAGMVLMGSPGAWIDLDAEMASRAASAAAAATTILGEGADARLAELVQKVTALQVNVFPALLGLSSIGALGLAVTMRGWLDKGLSRVFEPLRNFRFNDHLVWIWLAGLALILAPIGDIAARVGSNAVLFMGLLYVVRGAAVILSLVGGISVVMGVVGGVIVLLIYPLFAFLLMLTLLVGLGDTWLNVRSRVRANKDDR